MGTLYNWILGLHIAGGFTALAIGISIYIATKGGKYHRVSGWIYYGGMLVVVASAIAMHLLKPNLFLFYIAIFTLYLVYGGVNSARNKSLNANLLDKLMFIAGLVVAVLMITSLQLVLIVFGFLFLSLLAEDFKIYKSIKSRKEIPKNQWLLRHIGNMSGSYIATSTAFLVVNFQQANPYWLPWLLPTIIGGPVIAYFTRKNTIKPQREL